MNPRQDLIDLLLRTAPSDARVLARLAQAEARRTVQRRQSVLVFRFAGAVGAVLMVGALGWAYSARTSYQPAQAERFHPAPLEPAHAPPDPENGPREVPATAREPQKAPHLTPARSEVPRLESAPGDDPAASWEAVATALRDNDRAKANQLIQQLTQSPDPAVRDNAKLVQLRSLISQHRAVPLAPAQLEQLRALAHSGATSSIRDSARKVLRDLEVEPEAAPASAGHP